ncbi:YcaO-like family protein [Ramlibacter humi]|uniref:YcaO domain-containing protein n=1 Tax=Ramlibacter humi TaxID=2530451 RepID=A0A4Z0BCR8_9BURK|nr:YcaO-like family protein [Ramlibacter humi]TFY97065.1 hypothetical protein EZ216_19585 [Ramlibacter humi]
MEEAASHQIRPVLAGPGVVRGRSLTVRAPDGQLVVRANSRYLKALAEWCDGQSDLATLTARAGAKWGPSNFPRFLASLVDAGVLVDAQVAALRALRSPSTSPSTSTAAPTEGHVLPTEEDLVQLAGLLADTDALQLTFVLLRRIGTLAEGAYRPSRAGDSPIGSLRYLGPVGTEIYRAMHDPLLLVRQSVLLLVSASIQPSATCARSALLEAGAIAHQAKEWAASRGMGWAEDLPLDEEHLPASCALSSQYMLYAAGIGACHRNGDDEDMPRLAWMDLPGHGGLAIAQAAPATPAGQRPAFVAWGRSHDPRQALIKALGEYAERQALRQPAPTVEARMSELPGAVHPDAFVRYTRRQFADPALRVKAFNIDKKHRWVQAKEWTTGEKVWLPAECVHGARLPPEGGGGPSLARPTSSGCAADADIDVAIERATYELIERDAFVRHWLAQAPADRVQPDSLPSDIQERIGRLQAIGCEATVLCMTMGLGPAVLVLIRNARLAFVCAGSACGSDLLSSIERAFTEAEFAAVVRCTATARPKAMPMRQVASPEDHANLYATRGRFRRADVLIGPPDAAVIAPEIRWPTNLRDRLQTVAGRRPVYWVELPGNSAPRQLDGRRARAVRVLVPDCIPLAFGYGSLPEAMVSHPVSPVARFPHPLS